MSDPFLEISDESKNEHLILFYSMSLFLESACLLFFECQCHF